MKKIAAVVALLALGLAGCPDSKGGASAEERAEKKAAEIVNRGLSNDPAIEPASAPEAAEKDAPADAEPAAAEPVH